MTVLPAWHSVSWCGVRGNKGGGQGILCNLYNKFFGNWALMTGCGNPSILEIFRTSRKFCSRLGLSYFISSTNIIEYPRCICGPLKKQNKTVHGLYLHQLKS